MERSVGPEHDAQDAVIGTPPTVNERIELRRLELELEQLKEDTRQQKEVQAFDIRAQELDYERARFERQADSADRQAQQRIRYGMIAIIAGLGTLAALYIVSVFYSSAGTNPEQVANNVVASMGAITGVIGSLVSAYFGIQLGTAGRERAEAQRDRALAASSEETPSHSGARKC
jgi:hypothetical protein